VLFINTAEYAPIGAGPWLHVQLLRDLDRSTHELHVACAGEGPGSPAPVNALVRQLSDVDVINVDFGPDGLERSLRGSLREKAAVLTAVLRATWSFGGLVRIARRRRIQLIHTDERPRDAAASALLATLCRASCVIHMHIDYERTMSPLLRWALKRADGIIAISEFVRASLLAGGFENNRVFVVPNGIDPSVWQPNGRSTTRAGLGLEDGTPLVLTVCRLVAGKGIDDVIRALAIVRQEFPTARLLSVGQEQFAGYLNELKVLAAQLGVADAVTFAGWRPEVQSLLSACDLFAMPSRGEPFGLAYLEAMAMERPVVAYSSGASGEVVVHGETGLLAPEGDVAQLAENILQLLRDPELRRSMGKAGRARLESDFTLREMATNVATVYRRVVNG
jgi:glycosyltransferase involved in cell wall biosynthesis